jgi:Domain of unknown function (DUF4371)
VTTSCWVLRIATAAFAGKLRVDDNLCVHEDFLELGLLPKGDAQTVFSVVESMPIRFQLPINDCRGPCYDGASVMSGCVSGVSKRVSNIEGRAVFVHCLAHCWNLSTRESTRSIPLYRDMIVYVVDVVNISRASPKRSGMFFSLQPKN